MNTYELSALTHDAIIELFTLDFTPTGLNQVQRFVNYSQANGTDLSLGGVVYSALPISVTGFSINGQGQLPTPTLTLGNGNNIFTPLILQYQDLLRAKLTRHRIFAKHLDGGSDPNPFRVSLPDVYYISRKAKETELEVSFVLKSSLDLQGVQIPSRVILSNICVWQFKDANCGYVGPVTFCTKTLANCERNFGAGNTLRFSGYPGADNNRFG